MRGAIITTCRRLCALVAICIATLFVPVAASAQTIDLVPCVSKIRPGDTFAAILKDDRRFDCSSAQNHHPSGDYWVKMKVPLDRQPDDMRPVLRIASLWDDGFTMTSTHIDGSTTEYPEQALARQSALRLGPSISIALQPNRPPIDTILARVNGSKIIRGVLLAPQFSTPKEAINTEMALGVLYGAFGGLCLAMIVYTLALWRAMRQRFLLAYCAMVAAMATYAFFTTGAAHYVIDGMSGEDRLRITITLLSLAASTALIFVRHFFAASIVPKWLVRATYIQAAAMAAFALFYSAMAPDFIVILDTIYMIGFLPIPFLMVAYIHTAWQQKDPFLKYFLIAWSAPIISVAVRFLHGFGVLPYHLLIENSTLIAFAFEALVNSLAVGRRVWLLAQARDSAKSAEAIAKQMADTDPLTGLLNRRSFMRKLLERQNYWTLILVDIDHFKRVNDSLGHAGGDDAITSIGGVLRKYTPEGAIVARMGGEEFAIAYPLDLPLTPDPDRLLADVRAIALPQGYRITASIGIASRSVADENDWKILYRAADMALYSAKSNGRNCFICQQDERVAA